MLFGPMPVADAAGAILSHSVRAGGMIFRKGRVLSVEDIAALQSAGIRDVGVDRLGAADVPEDRAAARIAAACAGEHVRAGAAFTGRANLHSEANGLALIDAALVDAVNAVHESMTVATVAPFSRVSPRQMLATIKIIPFAAPRAPLETVEDLLRGRPLVRVAPFKPCRVALISTTLPDDKPSLLDKNRKTLKDRLALIGSTVVSEQRVAHETKTLSRAIADAGDADPVLIFGASAITDRRDVVPAAIEAASGTSDAFGMPVDPGNLLLTATRNVGVIVGAPGCSRSPTLNGI